MNDIEIKITVSVREPKASRTTVVQTRTKLPGVPHAGTTITVPSGDEAVPLRVDNAEFVVGREYVHVPTTPHLLERVDEDERAHKVQPAEILQMLLAAGFQVADVIEDSAPRPSRRRRAPEKE